MLLLITACISMTGFLMGNLLGTSRLVYALGRDGYLPRVFGRVTATHRVPMNALIAHATPAWVLAIAGSFDTLALISGGAICLVYGLVSFAAWRAQRKDLRERGDAPFVLPGGPLIPLIAIASMVLMVFTLTSKELTAIGIALAVLVAVYAGLHLNREARRLRAMLQRQVIGRLHLDQPRAVRSNAADQAIARVQRHRRGIGGADQVDVAVVQLVDRGGRSGARRRR